MTHRSVVPLLVCGLVLPAIASVSAQAPRPAAAIDAEVAAAERALRNDEPQLAESHLRGALYAGWMITGAAAVAEGRLADARDAFTRASTTVVENRDALQSLAMVALQLGEVDTALPILSRLVAAYPREPGLHRLLAQALVAKRQPEQAVQELEEAHGAAPDDLETTFALATGYLRVRKLDEARTLFEAIAAARPIPQTYVLIGRAYRDAARYDAARTALKKALAMDPKVAHAHYYLGTVAVMEEGVVRADEAIAEFRRELALDPKDPLVNLRLGMALVETHREKEALGPLQIAAGADTAGWQAFQYLGRCQLALGDAASAVISLRKAARLSASLPMQARIGNLHYQLATALRETGDEAGAAEEFKAAAALAAERSAEGRDALERYMADEGDAPGAAPAALLPLDPGGLGRLDAKTRSALVAQIAATLATTYLNLGVMQARAERFARAVTLFDSAAALDPDLPHLQYSLGVAAFNAQQYAKACPALERALVADPGSIDARRLLALASLETEDFARAADLLKDDDLRRTDPSLQYAYGVALVHSGHAAEAQAMFSQLLTSHADSAELNVLLGDAHAQQRDYDGAIAAFQRALALKPDVAHAHSALGIIHMRQGQLKEAAAELRAELASHPDDAKSRYTLATVLDLDGESDAALDELTTVLRARPEDADARYLTGKILLARGRAEDAVGQLEAAARIAPEDANIHYQLGLAYQRTGRAADAQREFSRFQELKDRRREPQKNTDKQPRKNTDRQPQKNTEEHRQFK
ncbi:MAG TPA: tetratricopeptide repeat protein [Vicinamibacterales bacterium]|nr:tetratricopeptide repeat protein [Vicinamibacterales bacterium]